MCTSSQFSYLEQGVDIDVTLVGCELVFLETLHRLNDSWLFFYFPSWKALLMLGCSLVGTTPSEGERLAAWGRYAWSLSFSQLDYFELCISDYLPLLEQGISYINLV